MARITAGSAVKSVVLPGLLPRVKALFFNGFSLLAYYVALVYSMARLIPAGHPYLNQDNIGRFGIFNAISAAWSGLDLKWKNIDRILFFFAVLAGLIMTLLYIAGAAFYLVTAPSMAASVFGLFSNVDATDDIALMMMDKMVGIPGIFYTKYSMDPALGPFPSPFHEGLHILFAYYSYGMFCIAMVLFTYFIVEIILETANTGTPFGKHFENIWVPLRLIAGIGLLIPIASGMNSAQWITLYTAKWGSNFATNAWAAFNESVDNALGLTNEEMIGLPVTPDFTGLAKDLFTIRACKDITTKIALSDRLAAEPSLAQPTNPDEIVIVGAGKKQQINPYFAEGNRYLPVLGDKTHPKDWPGGYESNFINLYLEGLRFYNGKDVRIIFGRYLDENRSAYPGGVEPICGEVLIPNFLIPGQTVPPGNIQASQINEGILIGAAHMYATLNMIEGINKTGSGQYAGGQDEHDYWALVYATHRYYYRETSQGQQKLEAHRIEIEEDNAADPDGAADGKNPNCMDDSNNDNTDDSGATEDANNNFPELGDCRGPIADKFFVDLSEKYQRYFSYGPLMGYEYYTGKAQQKLNERCSNIDCGEVTPGAKATCQRMLATCQKTRSEYAAFKPSQFPSVYYKDLGQPNPFGWDLLKYGWGGAGIWYKILAEKNGSLTGSTNSLPRVTHFPMLMENVGAEKGTNEKTAAIGGCERFNPATAGDTPLSQGGNISGAHDLASLYYNLCNNVQLNENIKMPGTTAQKTGNPVLDVINALFGTKSLFSFRENQSLNPMAQMAALGRALIDKAIENIMISAGGSAVGGLMSLLGQTMGTEAGSSSALISIIGSMASTLSSMLVSFAMTGLLAGILLFYVIPFLPFMYFFFAVGTWVKTVFEALVGVPLWALAHLKMDDGPGFSGKAAMGGYVLILEIFLRPIITLFALAASTLTFMALAYMLNSTWGIVTDNLVGFDPASQLSNNPAVIANFRPKIDQFFFTIVYVIFMYMTATGSFKLIDQIPDGIMRWLSPVKTWGPNDSADEMVGNVTQTVGVPAYTAMQKIVPQGVGLLSKVPEGIGGTMNDISAMTKRLGSAGKTDS